MPTNRDLKGLIKFLGRDEWQECFEHVFEAHFGVVLDAGNIEFDDLAKILDSDWVMTLWGCAFEDFLTQDFDVKGINIVDEYLRRRSWKEGAQAKAYMKALRSSVMSLYEVSEIVPGKSFMARDLLRNSDPVLVSERSATKTLKQWDRIAARLVSVRDTNVIGGGLLPFTPEACDLLFDALVDTFGGAKTGKRSAMTDIVLADASPIFTISWLFSTLDQIMATDLPVLHNGDGEEIVFYSVRFPFASGVTQKNIAVQLDTIPALQRESAKFWNWLGGIAKRQHEASAPKGMAWDTTMESGARVYGNIELKGRTLHLSVNSATRAEKGTILLQEVLGDLVRTPLTEIQTVDQMMAERADDRDIPNDADLPPEITTKIVHDHLDKHYRETLDQPVGMLGDISPRAAVKSTKGREQTVEWLKYIENRSVNRPDPDDPMVTYDFRWLWNELGIENLRR